MNGSESDGRTASRREALRLVGGSAAIAAVGTGSVGTAAAEEPDYGGFLNDVENYEETEDLRDEEEVAIEVGAGDQGLYFEPPAVWVDEGTEVVWEWTGEGGSHNVVASGGPEEYESEQTDEEGFTFEHTFEEEGISEYVCTPHEAQGMLGAVAVGDVEVVDEGATGGGGETVILGLLASAIVIALLSPLAFAALLFRDDEE